MILAKLLLPFKNQLIRQGGEMAKAVKQGLLLFFILLLPFFVFANPVARVQEGLVRPEPCHLASLLLAAPFGEGRIGAIGSLNLLASGGENGFSVWHLQAPPGLVSPILLGSVHGQAAAQVAIGDGALLSCLSFLDLGHQYGVYQIVDPGRVMPLGDFLLDQVRDREPIGEADYGAYLQAVVQAGRVDFDAFWQAGGANTNMHRGDLMNRPARLRGQVVRGEGVVRRIRKLEPLPEAVKQGVGELYESWVFQDLYGANPVCVITARLGGNLAPAENLQRPVRFSGYFLKAYRYQAAKTVGGKPVERECPLLVGPELVGLVEPPKPLADMGTWPRDLLSIILGCFALALALVWGMTWWMGSSDKRVRARLEKVRRQNRFEGTDLGNLDGEFRDFKAISGRTGNGFNHGEKEHRFPAE